MLERGCLTNRVCEAVEEGILTGKYPAGHALTEMELSQNCGVSRTPVRAALQRLETEGLVRLVPNKGAVVLGISQQDLVDIYRMRMRLEGLAAAMAATRMTDEDKEKLEETVALAEFYVARGDAARLRDLDSNFHQTVYLASGSRMLQSTLTELHRKIGVWRAKSLSDPARVKETTAEHRAILDALKAGDAALADELTSRHVERAMEHLLNVIQGE
ncbi:MAG: GntR family transcriptional regulator [Clostridia bacterium]|nr:GntR family transcriptional regulator [Clostridia bacterium]